jgi:hypothetical protein
VTFSPCIVALKRGGTVKVKSVDVVDVPVKAFYKKTRKTSKSKATATATAPAPATATVTQAEVHPPPPGINKYIYIYIIAYIDVVHHFSLPMN